MTLSRFRCGAAVLAACFPAATGLSPAPVGGFELVEWTVECGGRSREAPSAGGGFTLSGTIAQFDAGRMRLGSWELQGGFWPVDTGPPATGCYADCDLSGGLTAADFSCFQTRFAAADPYADCNGDAQWTAADFGCFQTEFATGCP